MNFENYKPSGILKSHVENYLVVKTDREISTAIIPEPSPVLSFRSKGKHSYWVNDIKENLPSCAITGLRNAVKPILLSENTETILVKFKPCEAALFFKEPQHLFSNQSVSLYDFLPKQAVSNIEEQLAKDNTNLHKISAIEHFLIPLFRNKHSYSLIKTAVQKIVQHSGSMKIEELASILNMSLDAFEKRFREIVGSSPKQFSSIVRLSTLINKKYNNQSLSEIAYEYGYFDQSHFIKDFKKFTGKTPLNYFKIAD